MKTGDFTGTGRLARLILRRDWILLLAWILTLDLLAVVIVVSFANLYPTPETLKGFADGVANSPGEIALLGPVFSPTLGGLTAWRWTMSSFIIGGVAGMLAVIRYTRTEEETGRLELLNSTAIGKYAALSAALIVVFGANLAMGVVAALIYSALGLPVAGSVALAFASAAGGFTFATVGAVVAQIAGSTGLARGIGAGILAITFLSRVIGDAGNMPVLSWLSPMGWMQKVRPFAGEQWWIFGLFIVLSVILVIVSFVLSSRRDLGVGILSERQGRAMASTRLNSPLALAWRLQRGGLIGWTAGAALIGLLLGYVVKSGTDQMAANPQFLEYLSRLGGHAVPYDSFFTVGLMIMGEVVTVYAIMATLRLQSEEAESHAEMILAAPVGRLQWAAGHLAIALIGTGAILAAFGLAAGLTYGMSAGNVSQEIPRMLMATLAYLPAIWIFAGIAVLLYGLLPRLTILTWGVVIVTLLIELLGEMQQVSGLILDLSPFTHVPKLLVSDGSIMPLVWLAIVAVALIAMGLIGFQRRSIE